MRTPLLPLLAPLVALAAGCPLPDDGVVCTDMAASSVNVSVVDPDGAPIPGATVTYAVGEGDLANCDAMGDGTWVCGWEVAGDITIHVQAEGYEDHSQVVTVGADECHVIPERLDVVLEPVECTAEVRPSVYATVLGMSGEDLTGVLVVFTSASGIAGPCEEGEADVWTCGEEVAGDVTVTAGADGHVPVSQTVTVGADECHVITESITLALDWADD
jgi:hypothetical protein